MPTFTQTGLIVASNAVHTALKSAIPGAYKVTSWQNDRSPKTQDKFWSWIKSQNLCAESVFDAAHGRRYILFIYQGNGDGRRACWDCITGART